MVNVTTELIRVLFLYKSKLIYIKIDIIDCKIAKLLFKAEKSHLECMVWINILKQYFRLKVDKV